MENKSTLCSNTGEINTHITKKLFLFIVFVVPGSGTVVQYHELEP